MGATLYPSCVVNLRLRFDETLLVSESPQPLPQAGDPTATSQVIGSPPTAPGFGTVSNAFGPLPPNVRRPDLRPLITQRGTDNLSYVMNRVPRSCTVELPAYRQAGKFTIDVDWRELPIDPRLVRSAGVEVFMGTVSSEDFATGMTTVDASGQRRSVLNTQGADGAPRDDLMLLAGIVDLWSTSQTDGGSTVHLEGRDLRGVFLDSPVNPVTAAKLDLTKSLDQVVTDLLRGHPAAGYMRVLYSPDDWGPPFFKPPPVLDREGLTRVRQKADGEGAQQSSSSDQTNFWDLITQYSFLVGAVPFFRGRNLVLRPASAIFDASKPDFSPNEKVFAPNPRVGDDGSPFEERRMVFGRNIKELTFERKLSGTKVPVVQVVSFDTSSPERGKAKLATVEWPPEDAELARLSGVFPSGQSGETDKTIISVPGIRDKAKLLGIARALYEEIGRGELGGSCKTTQLASFKGDNADPDLLRLRPGDPVEFLTDTRVLTSSVPGASSYVDSKRRSFEEEVAEVKSRLGGTDENLPRVLVASARSAVIDLLRFFRVANVQYNWSIGSGVGVAFDFQNYFVVRHDVNEQLGRNVTDVVSTTVTSDKTVQPKERTPPSIFNAAKVDRRHDRLGNFTNELKKKRRRDP